MRTDRSCDRYWGGTVHIWNKMEAEMAEAKKKAAASKAKKPEPPRDPEFKRLERMARDVFGTKAELTGNETHGKLIVHYQTADDLQRIWDILEIVQQNEA